MPSFRIGDDSFAGEIPALTPARLPARMAATARNCDLRRGSLAPIRDLAAIQQIQKAGEIRTIYKLDATWIYWTAVVDIVEAQLPNADNRIFYTGDAYPKQTNETLAISGDPSGYPAATRRLGVTAPSLSEPLVLEPQGTGDGIVQDSVSYVYTLVTAWGEESAPSPATAIATLEGDQYIRLKNFIKPSLGVSGNDFEYFRVYRLETGSAGGAEYQMIKARPGTLGATPVFDIDVLDVPDENTYVYDANHGSSPTGLTQVLGEVLPSETWDKPLDGMHSLIQYQNGILVGAYDREICLSEPLFYYAWPEEYRKGFNYEVVAVGSLKGAIVVMTTGGAYLVFGIDPASMIKGDRFYEQANISKRSTLSTRFGVIYSAPDGLARIRASGGDLLTQFVYTKKQWEDLSPETLIGFLYDEKYYGFFEGTGTGIVVPIVDNPTIVEYSFSGIEFWGGYVDPVDDTLYMLIKDTGSYYIRSWEKAATFIDYYWLSGIREFEFDLNMSYGRVDGDFSGGKTVEFKLYADGVLKQTKLLNDSNMFRCPGEFRSKRWQMSVEGDAEITFFGIATSPREMVSE